MGTSVTINHCISCYFKSSVSTKKRLFASHIPWSRHHNLSILLHRWLMTISKSWLLFSMDLPQRYLLFAVPPGSRSYMQRGWCFVTAPPLISPVGILSVVTLALLSIGPQFTQEIKEWMVTCKIPTLYLPFYCSMVWLSWVASMGPVSADTGGKFPVPAPNPLLCLSLGQRLSTSRLAPLKMQQISGNLLST